MTFKQQWTLVVALWGTLVFGSIDATYPGVSPVIPTLAPTTSSLSCGDLQRIARWSREKTQGFDAEALDSQVFQERALKVFLERIDPFRLLIVENEAKQFYQLGKKSWSKMLSGESCEFLTSSFKTMMPTLRARLEKVYASIPLASITPSKFSKFPSEHSMPEYREFAKNEAELKQRYTEVLIAMAKGTSSFSVAGYKNNLSLLFKQDLIQLALGDSPADPIELMMKGMLGAGDPYSTYFSPPEWEEFYYDLAGATSGVGVLVRKIPNGLLILKTVEGSPARLSKAIFPGDIILEIDRQRTAGLDELVAKNLLKGAEDTKVSLKLASIDAPSKIRSVTISRKEFNFEEARVSYKLVDSRATRAADEKVAIFSIPSFYGRGGMGSLNGERSSAEDLRDLLTKVLESQKKLSSVVLDLRGNPGGFLEEAVAMAGLFIGDRPVVTVIENNHKRILRDTLEKPLYQGPLVVLTDDESASAAEVLAGALQDYHRAIVVGDGHTYGKGSVQKLFHLDQEFMVGEHTERKPRGVVKLTTSVFYSPLGHTPINGGVKANIALNPKELPATKEDRPKILYHAVADSTSVLDADDLKKLERFRRANSGLLAEVGKRHEIRIQDIGTLMDQAFKKQMGIHGKPSNAQLELAETVAIARDYARTFKGAADPLTGAPVDGIASGHR